MTDPPGISPRKQHEDFRDGTDQYKACSVATLRWPITKSSSVWLNKVIHHYGDVIMGMMVSPITSLTIVYSTVYSGADQRKHQSSALLASVRGIHPWPLNSPHKWQVTRKMFPFDDVIIFTCTILQRQQRSWKTMIVVFSSLLNPLRGRMKYALVLYWCNVIVFLLQNTFIYKANYFMNPLKWLERKSYWYCKNVLNRVARNHIWRRKLFSIASET